MKQGVKKQEDKNIVRKSMINSNVTAPICETDHRIPVSRVSIPSDDAVEDAKDWVDNGSRL